MRLLSTFIAGFYLVVAAVPVQAQTREDILQTMKRATHFMVERTAYRGGYVWSELPDKSRRWGEMEAYPTMIWVQPPGTATVGHLFLDAYHATRDEYYYQAAAKAADALIAGQHRSGGWNYFIDFAGPASAKKWYSTIGANAWRLEEFQHYSDKATLDDAGTSEAMQFLLRIYLEKRDRHFKPALDKAINFVLQSQYANGGWPQRWPYDPSFPAYQSYITFNDDVAAENIKFLLMLHHTLGDARAVPAIRRAMNIFVATQQSAPQAGWGLQHTLDLKPAGARTYEPKALVTHVTAANVEQLLDFYRLTGNRKFLARIPEAIDWLASVQLPKDEARKGRNFPTFVEIGTNRPLYVHRRGSNIVNGAYYVDYDPRETIAHYSAFRAIDLDRLRREYQRAASMNSAELAAKSPLRTDVRKSLPPYFITKLEGGSDLNAGVGQADVGEIISQLNDAGWWPTPLRATSNPYRGPGPKTPAPGDYGQTHVGDSSDTSPYTTDTPTTGISTATYIGNMNALIRALLRRPAGAERG